MEEIRESPPEDAQPYWKNSVTPDSIKAFLGERLNRLQLSLLDVHDVKELLNLRCLRFAERLFALIDVRCTGYVSVEELSDFVYSFETNLLQFRLYMIFHCYDPASRGYLTMPEIKTMFLENLTEGGCEIDHRSAEYLAESILSRTNTRGIIISYPRLLEVAMYHPQYFCHLIKSKIPPEARPSELISRWELATRQCLDESGRWVSVSILSLILLLILSVGLLRYSNDGVADVLGWTHTLGRSASDIFKVLVGFFTFTLCRFTPFLYRKLPRPMHMRFKDIRFFRKIILVSMSAAVIAHAACQTLNTGKLSTTDAFFDPHSPLFEQDRPTIQSLLSSNVFITGSLLFVLFVAMTILAMVEDVDWPSKLPNMTGIKTYVYANGWSKAAALIIFSALIAAHVSTTFLRSTFRLPCLLWLWIVLALFLDRMIFRLLDPVSQVDVIDFRVLPGRGVLLTMAKPVDCRLGAQSFVSVSFPGTPFNGQRAFPVLSHPSENHLTVLVRPKDTWSLDFLRFCEGLNVRASSTEIRDSGDSLAVEIEGSGEAEEREQTAEVVSPNRAHFQIPDRLTRLNTRIVYLTQTQRILGGLGDDPQALSVARRAPPDRSEPPEQRSSQRNTGNFNVIFEITPASLSTDDSLRRAEQRSSSRQVQDEALTLPVSSPLLSDTRRSDLQIPLRASLRGPYKLNNAFNEERLQVMLSYPVLFLAGCGFTSLPLIPLCSYLLRRKTRGQRGHAQAVLTQRIVVSLEIKGFDDLLWLLELIEPLYDLQSQIRLEVNVHMMLSLGRFSAGAVFYDCVERMFKDADVPKLLLGTRVLLSFGRRDWEYEMVSLKESVEDRRVGVMVDASLTTQRQVHDWVQTRAPEQFDIVPLGIIAI